MYKKKKVPKTRKCVPTSEESEKIIDPKKKGVKKVQIN